MDILDVFAPCPRGLEGVLAEELTELDVASITQAAGGVAFRGNWQDVYRANLWSRIASRVLVRVAQAAYRSEEDIYRLALAQPWGEWFDPSKTLRVDVTASKSPLRSIEFVVLRVKDAIVDRMRKDFDRRPDIDTRHPEIRVWAYLDARHCSLYVDTSGEPLFKRGWRRDAGEAPLRENLAAGLLRLAGWKPGRHLIDPMCGSGTIVVEAAQTALAIAPGAARRFAFENLRSFDAPCWQSMLVHRPQETPGDLGILASDISGDAVDLTRAHLVSAGVSEDMAQRIAPKQIDARHIKASATNGTLILNPPYGDRIDLRGAPDSQTFFVEFGTTLKERFPGWDCYILTSDMALQSKIRLAPRRRIPLFNGAIECRLYMFEIVEGSHRAKAPSLPADSSLG